MKRRMFVLLSSNGGLMTVLTLFCRHAAPAAHASTIDNDR
jgi:hypothetical protein